MTCGDTETGVTLYAFPSSTTASAAKAFQLRARRDFVESLIRKENAETFRGSPRLVADYDARNWARLKEANNASR